MSSLQKAQSRLTAIRAEIARRDVPARLRAAITPALQVLLKPSRYKGAWGGRGSAKSYAFATLVVLLAITFPGLKVVCIREIQKSLEHSVKSLIEDRIDFFGLENQFRILNSHIETPGGGIIIFQGMQNHTAATIKSLQGFDIAWVEEAQSLSQRSLMLLSPTIRGERLPGSGSEIWFSWNPSLPTDPVDKFLRIDPPASDDPRRNAIVVRVNYQDNPWFPEVLRGDMERDRDRDLDKYEHVWGGGYETKSEARVFKNWKVDEFDNPSDAVWYLGADWGFSQDPSTLIRLRAKDRNLFIDHEKYKIGVEIDHLPMFFDTLVPEKLGWARTQRILADSARPETISYMQKHGYPKMLAAKKGPDSVKEGVIFLQGYDIIIHPRCRHTIDEFTHYSYKVDKLTQEVIVPNQLEDKKNHVIDPTRYAVEPIRKPREWVLW